MEPKFKIVSRGPSHALYLLLSNNKAQLLGVFLTEVAAKAAMKAIINSPETSQTFDQNGNPV